MFIITCRVISYNAQFRQGFESFINEHPNAPEFISLFIDEHLKKGLKGVRPQGGPRYAF